MSDIERLLDAIPVSDTSYDEWLRVGLALKNEGEPLSTWDNWSRNDPRYHDGECRRKWASFGSSPNPVTIATIAQIAKNHGYSLRPYEGDGVMDWNDTISYDGDNFESVTAPDEWKPADQLIHYLETLFDSDDFVGYVTGDVWQDKDGRWVPSKGVFDRTARQLIDSIRKHPEDLGATIGDWNPEVGAWIRFNPVDGEGVKNENVTAFRYALVESDTMPLSDQDAMYRKLELPIAFLIHSGGKSIHAIVRIDAGDYNEYRQRVEFLYDFLEKNGVAVDKQNRNPSRLSRMPGVTRSGNRQYIVAENIGRKSWTDWLDFVEGVSDELPDVESICTEMIDEPPPLAEELISGVLRCGHKMLISGSSKAGKSFLLMELSIAIAEGRPWLGFNCKKGRVLYVNLEIDRNSCINRFAEIYCAMHLKPGKNSYLDIWNLRGKALPLDKLVPKLLRRMRDKHYDAVIIDPIYKVITGDENNASDMAAFCNQFDRICTETGCATIYCHHHSKGTQGSKRAMDRASGSGVFARDPDAQLDMIQLDLTDEMKNFVRDGNATAWRLECSLREFRNFEPRNFWFEYPLHRIDDTNLRGAYAEGSPLANLQKSGKRTSARKRKERLDTAFEICAENGYTRVSDMAEYLDIEEKTIRSYLSEFKSDYKLDRGIVTRISSKEKG